MKQHTKKHEIQLKKQIKVTVNGTTYTINHIYTGTKTIKEMYEDLIKGKMQNL